MYVLSKLFPLQRVVFYFHEQEGRMGSYMKEKKHIYISLKENVLNTILKKKTNVKDKFSV